MDYSIENLNYLENWIDGFLRKQDRTDIHIKNKFDHTYRTATISKELFPSNKLLEVAMKFHDIGRFIQYEKIASFDDKILSHYILGKEYIESQEKNLNIKSSQELEKIKAVIRYHLGVFAIPKEKFDCLDDETIELIKLSAMIDGIDNGCIGALNYIEREIQNDEKHYIENNPNLDMKYVSKEVLDFFLNDQKFDKFKYCNTYAEYLLYAISLMIQSLLSENSKEVKKIATEHDAINKYKDLINRYINPDIANTCILHLSKFE